MQRQDIRAVENPISATFDLADDVNKRAPKVRKLVGYTRAFIYVWLIIDFLVIVALAAAPFISFLLLIIVTAFLFSIRFTDQKDTRIVFLAIAGVISIILAIFSTPVTFILASILIVVYYLGWIILDLLRDLRKFFDYYAVRHNVIRIIREADPVVNIPVGPDPVFRLLSYISKASSESQHVMSQPNSVKRSTSLIGRSGVYHNFDAIVIAQPSALWSLTGWAYPGWCILIKQYNNPPRLDDLKYLKHAAEDVVSVMKIPPRLVIALWNMQNGQTLSDDAYQFVTEQVVTFKHRGDVMLCSLQVIGESEDGTYDLVPFIAQIPS